MTNYEMAYQLGFDDACDGKAMNVNHSHNRGYVDGYIEGAKTLDTKNLIDKLH